MVAVCIHIDLEKSGLQSKVALEKYDCFRVGKLETRGHEDIFIRRIVDVDDETCHFHLEGTVASALGFTPEDFDPLNSVLEEIPELQEQSFAVTYWGRKRVSRGKIPSEGVIGTLLGAETAIGAFDLSLSGSTFTVSGDGPFSEVRWWLTDTEHELGVEVTARETLPLTADILIEASQRLESGIKILVLENNESDDESSSA